MPYIFNGPVGYASEAAETSCVPVLPTHAANDLLLIGIHQDGGTGTISVSGWTEIVTQTNQADGRHTWFGKIAASSSESNPTVSSTLSDEFYVQALTIRDADTTSTVANAIHVTNKSVFTTNPPYATPSLTTTVDDCLILYSIGLDGSGQRVIYPPDDILPIGRVIAPAVGTSVTGALWVGSANQVTAGSVPAANLYCTVNDGGSAFSIAVKNKSGGKRGPSLAQGGVSVLQLFSNGVNQTFTTGALSSVMSTLMGKTTSASATAVSTTTSFLVEDSGGGYNAISVADSLADGMGGVVLTLAATADLSASVLVVDWATSSSDSMTSPLGVEGFIFFVADSSGNWAAYRMGLRSQMIANTPYVLVVDMATATPIDQSATAPSASSITKIGFAVHRIGSSATTRGPRIRQVWGASTSILTGGSEAAPVRLSTFAEIFGERGSSYPKTNVLQGLGQVLLRTSLQIGNGSAQTYFNALSNSLEMPIAFSALGDQRVWVVGVNRVGITVYASPADTISFAGGQLSTPTKQPFTIHSSSSTSATYDFSGATLTGWDITWRSGIECIGANIISCYKITANGGTFSRCTVRGALDSIALTTGDPGAISDCVFTQGNAGHAIEMTTPGTYTFSGNTFSGYGVDGSTDAGVYNNSGGAITLNITGGGSTPTVRSGAGASTTVNNNVSITLENLVVGSNIRVEKVSDGSLVEFRTADAATEVFSVIGSVAYRIKVRKASGSPLYKTWETLVTPAVDQSIYVSQITD